MENKTEEYNGKVYENDKYYLFGDHGDEVFKCMKLKTINTEDDDYPFIASTSVEYRYIKELPSSDNFGTITDKPVDLEDGAVYMFDMARVYLGFYRESRKSFFTYATGGDKICSPRECTNIRKMEVVKDEH